MTTVSGGSVLWQLDIDKSKLTGELSKARSEINDTAKQGEDTFDKMEKKGKNSLAFVGKALAGLSVATAGIGLASIKAAADYEQSTIAFTTMLGSAENAQKLLSDLAEFGAKTPFELPGLIDSAKQLTAFGFAQEDIIPTMTNLGNIASGLGVPVGQLTNVFGQVRLAGRLMGQDLMQFTNAGVPLVAELAKVLGKSTAEVKDMVSEGKISFDLVSKAIGNMAGEGGMFFELMDKQSESLAGQWSNLQDGLGAIARTIGAALLPSAKSVVDWINTQVLPGISSFTTFASGLSSSVGGPLSQAFDVASTAVQQFFHAAKMGELLDFSEFGVDFRKFFSQDTLNAIFDVEDQILTFVDTLTRAKNFIFSDFIPAIVEIARSLLDSLAPTFGAIASFIADSLLPTFNMISAWIVDTGMPKFLELGQSVSDFINSYLVPLVNYISVNVLPWLGKLIELGFKALLTSITAIIDDTQKIVTFFNENEYAAALLLGVLGGIVAKLAIIKAISIFTGLQTAFVTATTVASTTLVPALGGILATLTAIAAPVAIVLVAGAGFNYMIDKVYEMKEMLENIRGQIAGTKEMANDIKDISNRWGANLAIREAELAQKEAERATSIGSLLNPFNAIGDIFRASGGAVRAGQPYIVGEQGMEMFVPDSNGTIVPNGKMGGNVNIENVNIKNDLDFDQFASELGMMMRLA